MTTYYLMVKTHKITGLQYLCQTRRKDPFKYLGSGTYWRRHLETHGENIETLILVKCYTKSALREWGIYYSKLWSVADSNKWANLTDEKGVGGWEGVNEMPHVKRMASERWSGKNHPRFRPEIAHKMTGSKGMKFSKIHCHHCGKDVANNIYTRIHADGSCLNEIGRERHPNYNPTIYEFIHDDGTVERCTQNELLHKYNLHQPGVAGLVNGGCMRHRGWRLAGDKSNKHADFHLTVYNWIHDNGTTETVTRKDLSRKYNLNGNCLKLVTLGKQSHHRGWRLSALSLRYSTLSYHRT
jgi:hypothetical protein